MHVIDASHPNIEGVIETSNKLIEELNANNIPTLYIFNKMDKILKPNLFKKKVKKYQPQLCLSAKYDTNSLTLTKETEKLLKSFKNRSTIKIKYQDMDIYHLLHKHGHIINKTYTKTNIELTVEISPSKLNKILIREMSLSAPAAHLKNFVS